MARTKRGIKARTFVNTAVSTAYATPTWTNIVLLGDAQVTADWGTEDLNVRLSMVKMIARNLLDLKLGGKILKERTATAAYTKLAASFADGDTQVDLLVLDGPLTQDGVEGFRFHAEVTKWSEDQGTGKTIFKDFELAPGLPDVDAEIPKSVLITSGSPVYTAIA